MKIGFTVNKENIADLEKICDEVIYRSKTKQTPQVFLEFITNNIANQIYLKNLKDVGLQLVQMTSAFEELIKHEKTIIFLERGFGESLSDQDFTRLILEHGLNDREVMSYRTQAGVKTAQAKGVKHGRPKIKQEVIEEIKYLARNQGRSVREIAEICHVSVGTVHKYTRKN